MLNVEEAFENFRQRLELSDTEQKDAERSHKGVRECIRGGFDIDNDFLTGSYRRHTKTKPPKDVDIFFCLGPKEKHWRDEHPDEILKAFEKRLARRVRATIASSLAAGASPSNSKSAIRPLTKKALSQ